MNARVFQNLIVASLGAFAIAASAETIYTVPAPATVYTVPPPATVYTVPAPATVYTVPAPPTIYTAPPVTIYTAPPDTIIYGTTNRGTVTYVPLSDADIRAYRDARIVCDRLIGTQLVNCRTQLAVTWSSVDPKCQMVALADSALDDCLRGVDHGGQ